MKVGLCWAGSVSHKNDAVRSLPRSAVLPLAVVPGIEWYGLSKDAWTPELGEAGLPNALEGCHDWHDTAMVLLGHPPAGYTPPLGEEMPEKRPFDVVITVDTAIAHLSGGLGIPTWILLAAVPDMRWMLNSTTTPWYRSARLFRQQIAGEWGPVMDRVADALLQEVHARAV